MKDIKNVDTRLRYDISPNHREIVASIVLQELHNLFRVEDEDWMKRRINKYMHQCLTNINKRIPMKLFQPEELYVHCRVPHNIHYKQMYQPYLLLGLLLESLNDKNEGVWMWENGKIIYREDKDYEAPIE